MRKEISEKELFETIPVPRAVATLAVPTIISQVVTMIYNLADTFFVGQIGNPYMVAAVSLVSPCGAAQRQRLYFPSLHFCSADRSLISWAPVRIHTDTPGVI